MTQERNKGGRPTNAELEARGIIQTDLKAGLRLLKKSFAENIRFLQEQSDNPEVSLQMRIKLKKELSDMFVAYYKADIALKKELAKGTDSGDNENTEEDKTPGVVLAF
ncbi:hypothetical protein PaSzw1_4 [Pseudomonas phage PaSzW-1]|uniref:Uncharacterized protein n=1 Tax=Pseudomonas phage PaZq-1 TaxID=2419747 RepID=A0A411BDR5_9CAUD|nr:hypothetical protein PaoP5_049 [Pseudomonas phage PaoP5]YP_010762721.1 hypothetical protein QE326_gp046 [Pseudomonas phage PaZq-1]ALT58330.1 hypothetical protein PaoP5_049 [Pseudomonas phage PaoP5]QAX99792.1 hypothetical protein [Pseudomonas phage PaZq-1]QAY01571.1 hypothetical protein PaSzw1_4 [Pseudomonas phage PaSzW-1]